mmetsp:Transcript_43371/g.97897  ORF Transcript_43371/g.97897 Transcript_43371/m.97897 type:complete len:243 (-) Transcript_43371:41-769(-)
MAGFHTLVLEPALAALAALRGAPDDRELAAAHARLQEWVHKVQLPHFGAAYTHRALEACGARCLGPSRSGEAWVAAAREAVARAAWWSCPHAAVSSQGVAAWVAASLEVAGGSRVEESGRVFLADDSAEHSILVERMLQPIYLQVPRNGHAERRALIELLRAVSRAFGSGNAERWEDTAGSVRLYASHYPCMSCLVVIAQFARRLPRVTVFMEFDNAWGSWRERPAPSSSEADGMLIMGRSV